MRHIVPLLILSAFSAHAEDAPQTEALPTRYVCVESKAIDGKGAPKTALQMLEYVNGQLDRARVLTFRGEVADFGSSLPDEPAFTVIVRHNDVSILERGFLLDGGEGCNAMTSPPSGKCSWRVLDFAPNDQSAEHVQLVWETLVLDGPSLTLRSVYSGATDDTVEKFDCTDSERIERYLRR